MSECLLDGEASVFRLPFSFFEMMPFKSNHRAILEGLRLDDVPKLDTSMCVARTLAGYIAQHCRQLLAVAESELHEQGRIEESFLELLYDLRDQYNDALGDDGEDGEVDPDEDMEIFSRFKHVLGELPREEVRGRPFPKRRGDIRQSESLRGGYKNFHRKP